MTSVHTQWPVEITQFHSQLTSDAIRETIGKASHVLQTELVGQDKFLLGQQVQDPNEVQIMVDQSSVKTHTKVGTRPETDAVAKSLRPLLGEANKVYRVAFQRPAFEPHGAAMANVVEFAQTWFPASTVTPEFQANIEADFMRFNELCEVEAKGNSGWTMGWTVNSEVHPDVEEEAMAFLILRGWESMQDFERLLKSAAFQEAVPILLAWKSPSKMVWFPLRFKAVVEEC